MFRRPDYCSSCGEKIERIEWHIWTSNRFCELCETENRIDEWLPRILTGALVIFGLFGVGTLLRGPAGPADSVRITRAGPERSLVTGSNTAISELGTGNNANRNGFGGPVNTVVSTETPGPGWKTPVAVLDDQPNGEPVFICGAQTKKGTACLRKVRGGGRCWQHKGRKAILPPEKLLVRTETK